MKQINETPASATSVKVNNKVTNNAKAMKKELLSIQDQTATSRSMQVQIMTEEENGCITSKIENRKFALIRENRPILDKNVYHFLQVIHLNKYNNKMPLLTIEAQEVIDKCQIVDFEGNPILKENASEYLVILDGQHRIKAFTKINEVNKGTDKEIVIPNVYIESNIESVPEYLVDINTAGHDWSLADKYCVAAINTKSKLVKAIHELIKRGFNASAAVFLCTGKKLSQAQLAKLLQGDTSFLYKDKKRDTILIDEQKEEELLTRAEQYFITGASIVGDKIEVLARRYHVIGFHAFAVSRTTADAITALKHLTFDDLKKPKENSDFMEMLKEAYNKSEQAKESVA